MTPLIRLIPDAETVLIMHPSELAGYVLESLMSLTEMESGNWHRGNFCRSVIAEYSIGERSNNDVGLACSSAWSWLESNGLIAPSPTQDGGWFQPTRRALEVQNHQALLQVISNQQLPEEFLHPELLINARPLFLQSRFDTAVFEAFKALEVSIRTKAKLGQDQIGVKLATNAFNPESGALTDMTAEGGERVALMNLMTGALGSYKNPSSHRKVEISVDEARDMITLASHLLKIVDTRGNK